MLFLFSAAAAGFSPPRAAKRSYNERRRSFVEILQKYSLPPIYKRGWLRFFSIRNICEFCDGYPFIFLYAAFMFVSSLCGLEAIVYAVTALLVVLICLFAKDTRAILPPAVLIVYSTSWMHTPQADSDFFNTTAAFVSLGVLGAIAVAMLAARVFLVRRRETLSVRPQGLKGGMIALAAAFLLNGALSPGYVPEDLLFGALIALSFVALYFFIRQTGARRADNGLYFAVCCASAGIVIFLQIVYALLFRQVFCLTITISDLASEPQIIRYYYYLSGLQILQHFPCLQTLQHLLKNGSFISDQILQHFPCLQTLQHLLKNGFFISDLSININKDAMIAGWGMSNNFGGMLAMFLPASLYLAYKIRHGWIFYLFAFLQLAAVACTLSRTALLTGGILLLGGAILLSVVRSPRRTFIRVCNLLAVAVAVVGGVLFFDRIRELFATIFDRGFGDSNRFAIWRFGMEKFLSSPLFGYGFYIRFYPDFGFDIANWVFPDMYHNIFVQIFASCGLVGMVAYLYHISQVLCLLFRRPTADRIFYLGIVLAVCGASLLDNHIFHIFPALLYSLALGLWEKDVYAETRGPLRARDRADGFLVRPSRR